ncbi:hypothetical protein Tco_1224627, partial [Tanacetum coccineum]
ILPFAAWVPIGKSNYVLDLQKKQKNLIFKIYVDILQNTNFFKAFTASALVPAIHIQQFWNTLTYEAKTEAYSFQLDETRFVLDVNLLREALEITPIDQAHKFVSPPSGDSIMDFVNELGYTEVIHFVSRMAMNNLYQPWRAILSMINQCLTSKTYGHDRPRYPVLQMLWEIITSSGSGSPTKKGRKDKPHVIPYCRFTKLIICHLGRIHNIHQRSASQFHLAKEDLRLGNLKFVSKGEVNEVFGMSIPNELISNNIKNAPYYNAYLEMVAKHDQKVAAEKEGKKKTTSTKQPKSMPATEKSSKPAPASKPKVTKEKPSKPSTAKPPKPKPAKGKSTKATPLQKADKGKVAKVCNVKSSFQLVNEPNEKPAQPEPEPEPEHQSEGEEYDVKRAIQMSLESFHAEGHAHVGGVAIRKPVAEATRPLRVVEGKGKAIDDTSANIVRDSPSPADAETGDESDKTNSGGDTEILHISEEQGEDVDNQVNLEEKTAKLDQGQAGSDPGKTLESRPLPEKIFMDEDQAGPDPEESRVALAGPDPEPTQDEFMANVYPNVHESLKFLAGEHVILENPLSSTGTLSLMKNLEDAYTIRDQFFNDKSTEDEPGKLNVEAEVVSMVTVPIYQASSSVPPLSTPVIDLSPSKPAPSTTQVPIFTATTMTTTITRPLLPPPQQQSITDFELVARLRDLPHMIDETIRETIKEAVQVALQAPLRDRFRDLPEADMKEMLHQRMFESGSYKSLPEHVALYEALEASMERAQRDELFAERDKSHKKRRDDQDPPPPPRDSDLSKKKPHNSDATSSSSKQQSGPHSEQPIEDIPMPAAANISDSEDTGSAHLLKIKPMPEWLKPIP